MFIDATTTIRHDQRLGNPYTRASARSPQKEIITAVRKMLVISWHMLAKMESHRAQNHELTQRKKMERKSKTV
ncbi:MAG: hypothetical protein ABI337_01870 [Nitrososphaera sp.]|jgi:hypothetical protein